MRVLLLAGTVVLSTGVFMLLFGGIYAPVRSLEPFVGVYYGAPLLSPPASWVYFVGSVAVNYTLNYVGIVLMLLGIVMMVKGYGQRPKVDSLSQPPST